MGGSCPSKMKDIKKCKLFLYNREKISLVGKNEVPEETSNTIFHSVACTFTRLSQREKNDFNDVVSTPKRFGDHCKSFPDNRKNSNFLEPRIFVLHYS